MGADARCLQLLEEWTNSDGELVCAQDDLTAAKDHLNKVKAQAADEMVSLEIAKASAAAAVEATLYDLGPLEKTVEQF
jgi:hypothetical protein